MRQKGIKGLGENGEDERVEGGVQGANGLREARKGFEETRDQ